jgi:hypothetical protein
LDNNGLIPGEGFTSPMAAVIDFGLYTNATSINFGREFGTRFYSYISKSDNKLYYSYVQPVEGGEAGINPKLITPVPEGTSEVALGHTHGNYLPDYGNGNDKFSEDNGKGGGDKGVSNKNQKPLIMVTPNGSLEVYFPSTGKTMIIDVKNIPSDPKDPTRKNQVDPKQKLNNDQPTITPGNQLPSEK